MIVIHLCTVLNEQACVVHTALSAIRAARGGRRGDGRHAVHRLWIYMNVFALHTVTTITSRNMKGKKDTEGGVGEPEVESDGKERETSSGSSSHFFVNSFFSSCIRF